MRQPELFIRSVLVFSVLLGGTAARAQELPEPRSAPVRFFGAAVADAERYLIGSGVPLDGPDGRPANIARTLSPCGGGEAEIVWREVQRDVDPQGGTHVTYRQHLAGGGGDAELVGSAIAVHRTAEGKLLGVSGRQFESVVLSGCTSPGAAEAVAQARDRVLAYKGELGAKAAWNMSVRLAERVAETKLKFVQIDGVFRPAWFTIGDDAEGQPHEVVLDAEDGRPIAIQKAARGGNCQPSGSSYVSAIGIPVRPELAANQAKWRGMKAMPVIRGTFSHEGVWAPSLPLSNPSVPNEPSIRLIVYHGTKDSTYKCVSGGSQEWTLFPLKIDPAILAVPIYDNIGTTWYGRAAGDALWNTYRTMFTFRALGRKGWDNNNGDARIIVHNVPSLNDGENAEWMPTLSNKAPAETVRIAPPKRMYSLAASLDAVAHEFGHGVIIKSKNFISTENGNQFHEGWADVIGMLVEKSAQPSGSGLEQASDWRMHEDAAVSGYARAAEDDDADGVPGHDWVGPNYTPDGNGGTTNKYWFDDRLHRLDGSDGSYHASGNMLNVAYRIMAAGGSSTLPSGLNPVCARKPMWAGCESSNAIAYPNYLGPDKAGALLFYALQFTVQVSSTWTDVADRVMEAAFLKYNTCQSTSPTNASGEQNAVRKAFAGIGYPTNYGTNIQCQ